MAKSASISSHAVTNGLPSPIGRTQVTIAAIIEAMRRVMSLLQLAASIALLGAIALVLAGTAPSLIGAESYSVYSGSMEPAIHVGALAVVKPVKSADLQLGDIITYRTPTQPDVIVTHRLIAIEDTTDGKRQYRTRGDANTVEDLVLVDPNAVLGKVIYSVPYAGYIVDFSKRNTGKLLFIGLPSLLLSIDFVRSRLRLRAARRAAPAAATAVATTTSSNTTITATDASANGTAAGVGAADVERIHALLARSQQALEQGYFELAERAADGVLALDARHEAAWIMKARATRDPQTRAAHLQTALVLNPGSEQVATMLDALRQARQERNGRDEPRPAAV